MSSILSKARTKTPALPVQTQVQPKLLAIIDEINSIAYERQEVTWSIMVALLSHQHVLMVGPGGTAKSFISRAMSARIVGARYFETALDETTTPDAVFGPPDIPAMVERGKTRRFIENMLPEADLAFIDEFFNANGPVLHGMQPILNERKFHNGGEVLSCPLRTVVAGTNKLNADADQAALWDRIHIRLQVGYLADRDNVAAMLRDNLRRKATNYTPTIHATVLLEELDAAHDEALSLPIPQQTEETFLDLLAVLRGQGVEVSDRRKADAYAAVVANAWLAGHSEVQVGDLGILQHMLWTLMDDAAKVRNAVLDACNPGEKAALALLDDLTELSRKYEETLKLDKTKRSAAAIDLFKKTGKIAEEATPLRKKAVAGGASTIRIDELIRQCETLKIKIGTEALGLPAEQVATLNVRR